MKPKTYTLKHIKTRATKFIKEYKKLNPYKTIDHKFVKDCLTHFIKYL